MAIQNIYSRTKQRGAYPDSDTLFLDAIMQRLVDLQSIVHERPNLASSKQQPPRPVASSHIAPAGASEDPAAVPRGSASKTDSQVRGANSSSGPTSNSCCRGAKGDNSDAQSGSVAASMASVADGQGRSAHNTSLNRASIS